jgi:AraC-like DNA-binding protein
MTDHEFEQIYRAAARIVEEEYPQRLTQSDVARMIGCSPIVVRRAFARFGGGRALRDHLRDVRLRRAAELLVRWPEVRVHEIAHTVGYPNATYFAREFRDVFGRLPAAYRFITLNPEYGAGEDRAWIERASGNGRGGDT